MDATRGLRGEPCLSMSRPRRCPSDNPCSLITVRSWAPRHTWASWPNNRASLERSRSTNGARTGFLLVETRPGQRLGVCSALQIRPPPRLIAHIVGEVVRSHVLKAGGMGDAQSSQNRKCASRWACQISYGSPRSGALPLERRAEYRYQRLIQQTQQHGMPHLSSGDGINWEVCLGNIPWETNPAEGIEPESKFTFWRSAMDDAVSIEGCGGRISK